MIIIIHSERSGGNRAECTSNRTKKCRPLCITHFIILSVEYYIEWGNIFNMMCLLYYRQCIAFRDFVCFVCCMYNIHNSFIIWVCVCFFFSLVFSCILRVHIKYVRIYIKFINIHRTRTSKIHSKMWVIFVYTNGCSTSSPLFFLWSRLVQRMNGVFAYYWNDLRFFFRWRLLVYSCLVFWYDCVCRMN